METTNQQIAGGLPIESNGLTNDRARKYMHIATAVAQLSKDKSTKVGAVIIGKSREIRTAGYNGAPRGCEADARQMKMTDSRGRKKCIGSATPNSTPSRMRRVWGHLWRAVLCLLLILLAWTALALFVRQASSVSSPSAPATTSAPVGMSTPSALPDSSKSAASLTRR